MGGMEEGELEYVLGWGSWGCPIVAACHPTIRNRHPPPHTHTPIFHIYYHQAHN
jgi:hypothetical protein